MTFRKWHLGFLVFLVVSIALSGCGGSSTGTAGTGGGGGAGGGVGGDGGGEGIWVDAAGALISIDDVQIEVPSGAVPSGGVWIDASRIDDLPAPAPGSSKAAGKTIVLSSDPPIRFSKPVRVTAPYDPSQIDPGGFPVILYWDEIAEAYFPVTMEEPTGQAETVTFRTVHFSHFILVAAGSVSPLSAYDTLFKPDFDSLYPPNFGAYFDPGGRCDGFSMYAMWYYVAKRRGKPEEEPLAFLYRNLPPHLDPMCSACDPFRWEDDPTAREVAAWSFPWDVGEWYELNSSPEFKPDWMLANILFHFDALRAPQVVYMSSPFGAHSVLAYKYEPPRDGAFGLDPAQRGRLFVYDSNLCTVEPCPSATLYYGIDPDDPTGPLRFFGYSADASYTEFSWQSLSTVIRPAELEAIYQQAKVGFAPSSSTFVFPEVTSAIDAQGDPVSVSAGHIWIPAHGPITVRGVIDAQGRTTLNEPKFMPSLLGVWLDGQPLQSTDIDSNGNFSFVVPEQAGDDEHYLWLIANDGDPWDNSYAGFSRITLSLAVDLNMTLTREGSLVLCQDGMATLRAEVTDLLGTPYYGCTVEWSSNNPSVASVSGGIVTAGSPGRATITARCSTEERSVSVKVVSHDPATQALGHRCFLVTVKSMSLDYPDSQACGLVSAGGKELVSGYVLYVTRRSTSFYDVESPPGVGGVEDGEGYFALGARLSMNTISDNPYVPSNPGGIYDIRRTWDVGGACELTGNYVWDFYGQSDPCAGRNTVSLIPVDYLHPGGDPFYLCE